MGRNPYAQMGVRNVGLGARAPSARRRRTRAAPLNVGIMWDARGATPPAAN